MCSWLLKAARLLVLILLYSDMVLTGGSLALRPGRCLRRSEPRAPPLRPPTTPSPDSSRHVRRPTPSSRPPRLMPVVLVCGSPCPDPCQVNAASFFRPLSPLRLPSAGPSFSENLK
eukprot:2487691-Rhodomonas_salina.1